MNPAICSRCWLDDHHGCCTLAWCACGCDDRCDPSTFDRDDDAAWALIRSFNARPLRLVRAS